MKVNNRPGSQQVIHAQYAVYLKAIIHSTDLDVYLFQSISANLQEIQLASEDNLAATDASNHK